MPPSESETESETDTETDTEVDGAGGGVWLSWTRLVVLLAAVAFLAGAVVYYVSERETPAGAVDVGFYQDMTTHHEQAIDMSLLELANGEDPTALSFANEILIFQNRELGIMATRLQDWGEAGDRPAEAMAWMGMPTPADRMPGMATQDQLDELRAADGRASDKLFLELMAEHHRGGLHMAGYAAEHAESADVRELAGRMARFQAIEINEMSLTAERLGFDVDIERVDVPPEP